MVSWVCWDVSTLQGDSRAEEDPKNSEVVSKGDDVTEQTCENCGNYQEILSLAHKMSLVSLHRVIEEKCFNYTIGYWTPKPGVRWRKRHER